MCVCVCICMYVCVRPFTVKASSVWISWTARERINDVVLKTFISCAKSLHRYFRMKHLTFLTNHFILFTHWKRAKPRLNFISHDVLFFFLGGAPSSICHCTSSDHNFWYTYIKWWYLKAFFSFFQNFDFLAVRGITGQKIAQNDK